jgi:hypothetical protein
VFALAQLEIVSALVEEARQRGATVVTGGQARAALFITAMKQTALVDWS